MTLDADEFIRRFLLHVLPRSFMRIRHYGFLANRHKAQTLRRRSRSDDLRDRERHERLGAQLRPGGARVVGLEQAARRLAGGIEAGSRIPLP